LNGDVNEMMGSAAFPSVQKCWKVRKLGKKLKKVHKKLDKPK